MDTAHADPNQLIADLERALDHASLATIPGLIGDLERLQTLLAARLMREAIQSAQSPRPHESLDELQHLTPHQVAGILSLKAAYVHELCRTGRIPASKSGKYWMIPVTGLRRWLAYQNRDVDGNSRVRVDSPNPAGDTRRVAPASPGVRPRRPPVA